MIFDYREKNSKTRELCVDFFQRKYLSNQKILQKFLKKFLKTY